MTTAMMPKYGNSHRNIGEVKHKTHKTDPYTQTQTTSQYFIPPITAEFLFTPSGMIISSLNGKLAPTGKSQWLAFCSVRTWN